MQSFIQKLKEQLIKDLNLEEIRPEDIDENAPLFGDEGLGLDSIDVLEMILILEKYYGLRVTTPEEGKKVFQSVNTMAEYILANQKG